MQWAATLFDRRIATSPVTWTDHENLWWFEGIRSTRKLGDPRGTFFTGVAQPPNVLSLMLILYCSYVGNFRTMFDCNRMKNEGKVTTILRFNR